MNNFFIRKAAVLGTGVMGRQIAALLANAGIRVVFFGRAVEGGDPHAKAKQAIDGLCWQKPSPLTLPERVDHIEAANYDHDLAMLEDCDLIVESIVETLEAKASLLREISPRIPEHAVVATNTSGLSISRLAQCLPEAVRSRFCGLHFFNPPHLLPLVELIAAQTTAPVWLDRLESWLVTRLGKGVVRASDTPNFIGNRIGFFSLLAVMRRAQDFGLGFDEADALTGTIIGRAKSATFRTADIVGLDTTAHVIETMRDSLPDDPWHVLYAVPQWMSALIEKGALGQKAGGGIYRKEGKTIRVLDAVTGEYHEATGAIAPEIVAILKAEDAAKRFAQLRESTHPQAQFLWAVFRDLFHYVACHLGEIADTARDVDFAMRWGFGWAQGPFETWQAAGWHGIAEAVREDVKAGRSLCAAPLPEWAFACVAVHEANGSYSPRAGTLQPRSALPVYRRQLFPQRVLGEVAVSGETLWENGGVRFWHLPQVDSGIAILSIKTRNHTLGREVVDGLREALARAEAGFAGAVLWHEAPFSYGANLKEMMAAADTGEFDRVESYIADFQRASMAIKYCRIPVVTAVRGMALGGGCEFLMHAAHRVVALDGAIGLVETAAGLIPAGGGCKEFAIRAGRLAEAAAYDDPLAFVLPGFDLIAGATVSRNAEHARQLGFVRDGDSLLFNADELLYVALRQARTLAESAYFPALPPSRIRVAGRAGIDRCEALLAERQARREISEYDRHVAGQLAMALCGGDVGVGAQVDETYLFDLERSLFVGLLRNEKTQQRVRHLLEKGQPLKN